MDLKSVIRDVPDFPKPGIMFKDITPLLKDPRAFRECLDLLEAATRDRGITGVVGIEARGLIFGAPLADRLGVGFIPIRKPCKLPYATISESYLLEYGSDTIEMHRDALGCGDTVVLIDDLLATGGTMQAAVRLVEKAGARVDRVLFVVELLFLQGRERLAGYDVQSLISF